MYPWVNPCRWKAFRYALLLFEILLSSDFNDGRSRNTRRICSRSFNPSHRCPLPLRFRFCLHPPATRRAVSPGLGQGVSNDPLAFFAVIGNKLTPFHDHTSSPNNGPIRQITFSQILISRFLTVSQLLPVLLLISAMLLASII